jgi:hypothetical protein
VGPGGVGPIVGRAVVGVAWRSLVGTGVGGTGATVGTGVGVDVAVAAGGTVGWAGGADVGAAAIGAGVWVATAFRAGGTTFCANAGPVDAGWTGAGVGSGSWVGGDAKLTRRVGTAAVNAGTAVAVGASCRSGASVGVGGVRPPSPHPVMRIAQVATSARR